MSTTYSAFTGTYSAARANFLHAAEQAGGRIDTRAHPLTGPSGDPLAMDVALLGDGDAKTVVVCLCGVHGAEGYAGSAVQTAWLRRNHADTLAQGVAMLFVHGVNPWGFAHGLRGTEDNIDVNRNWLDHTKPHPQNPLYGEIHPYLCPDDLSASSIDRMLDAAARFVDAHGQWALEDAVSRGQYTYPDGYHFGGTELAWSTQQLRDVLRIRLRHAERVAYVDFHSGPPGDGETIFLCFSRAESPARRRAADWWGQDALNPRTVENQWGAPRPTRSGIIFWGIEHMLTGQAEVAGAVVEFCSSSRQRDPRRIMRIAMLERWLRFVGGLDAPEAPAYLTEIRENYAPRRPAWEARVETAGIRVLDTALLGATDWAYGR